MTVPEQAVRSLIYPADASAPHPASLEQPASLSTPQVSADPKNHHPVDQHSVYELRGERYRLNDLEARMLVDVGKFRVIEKTDLLERVYQWNRHSFERDFWHLHRQNLVRTVAPSGDVNRYIVLTRPAKLLAEKYFRTHCCPVNLSGRDCKY